MHRPLRRHNPILTRPPEPGHVLGRHKTSVHAAFKEHPEKVSEAPARRPTNSLDAVASSDLVRGALTASRGPLHVGR